ncbi:transcriptional regulator, LysR family [Rubrobacter xylanophilus DSM 9941]|uniref:Transcriptional regulator, LysR family n=1 Tax=Rubrobacter xylanophilus (strain DSM 9941 / JCM 11954 / NBRC 16129 / PRD-1) TaxID=266117 RepID=Q1AVN1_RUBXD|nr:LysR family transcriptional regulator [Rubrobacter xylanophilus]ABG04547.1 transcriptional regulator, LysR family [Rubrobacter xylanophilus DSM 9941]
MELRHLRYFVAVAEEMSFNRAARRLRMAQPPLSTQIRQLEKELGVRLFDRTSRGVRLTEAGTLLLEEARRLFVQLDQTTRAVQRVGHGEVGRLALGFVPSATNEVLPPILREFTNRFPGVELFLREMRPDMVVQRLHEQQIDAGFLFLPLEDAALHVECISREPLVLALPEAHPLASRRQVRLQEVSEEPFVLPARYPMPGLYGQVTAACRAAGFEPKAVQKDVWLMQTIVGLVAGGLGVALVPASVRNLNRKGVAYRPVRGLSPSVELGMVWRREARGAVLDAFLQVAREVSARRGPRAGRGAEEDNGAAIEQGREAQGGKT